MRKEKFIALLACAAAGLFAAACRSAAPEAPAVSLAHIYTESMEQAAAPVVTADGEGVVRITSATEGAAIYYTTDGSEPTTASARYEGPITDLEPGEYTIRAIAVAEGYEDSDIGEGLAVVPEDNRALVLVLQDLHFMPDSPELLDEDKARIETIADAIKDVISGGGEYEILVEGYAAAVKTPEGQQILSEQRAETVAEQLAEFGIDSSLFVTRGYGGTRPVADNSTEEGRAQNRRVVITVTPKEE